MVIYNGHCAKLDRKEEPARQVAVPMALAPEQWTMLERRARRRRTRARVLMRARIVHTPAGHPLKHADPGAGGGRDPRDRPSVWLVHGLKPHRVRPFKMGQDRRSLKRLTEAKLLSPPSNQDGQNF